MARMPDLIVNLRTKKHKLPPITMQAHGWPPRSVTFQNVRGRDVPMHPWPQTFYVACELLDRNQIEVRPLTLTGLLKGVGRNFVTVNWWRVRRRLWTWGLFTTRRNEVFRWSDWTWHPRRELARRRAEPDG